MSESQPVPAEGQPAPEAAVASSAEAVDVSCRVPLLVLFLSAAVWFLLGSLGALLASLKFHAPVFLADWAWLTYGRLRPAASDALLYGACVQAALGVGLWLLARLGRTPLRLPGWAFAGGFFWNLGVTVGCLGILHGDSTGFENLEMPYYALPLLFLGYVLLALPGVLLFHRRTERQAFVSQWFLLAALFWFPWIFSSAEMLLLRVHVRGVAQAVIAWWYTDNLLIVWFGLVGLATVFYFVPKLAGRALHSHYLALLVFWLLLIFGSWGGVPTGAPVPAWLGAVSAVSRVLMLVPLLAVAWSLFRTAGPLLLRENQTAPAIFVLCGALAYLFAGLMRSFGILLDVDQQLHFTWFATARTFLQSYGFLALVLFGAIYYILPRLLSTEFRWPGLVRAHVWAACLGVLLMVLPLAIGGVVEAANLQKPEVAFPDLVKATLPFLRISTVGELALVAGHLFLLFNLVGTTAAFYRARATVVYEEAVADLYKPAGGKA